MADTTLSPTTMETVAGADVAWVNPNNAIADDATYTTASLAIVNPNSNPLRATGFDFSGIPSFAVIEGLGVTIKAKTTAGAKINTVSIVDAGVVLGSDTTDTALTSADTRYHYGGSGSFFGITPVVSDLDSDFGCDVICSRTSGSPVVSIDHVQLVVYWSKPGGHTPQVTRLISGGKFHYVTR